jgi:signal transduction histidine kinase
MLAAYLSAREKGLRATALAAARVMTRVRPRAGAAASLLGELHEFKGLVGAVDALLVAEECASRRLFLWGSAMPANGHGVGVPVTELPASMREAYLFPMPTGVDAYYVTRRGRRQAAIDERGLDSKSSVDWPGRLAEMHPAAGLMAVSGPAVEGFRVRLFLLDPMTAHPEADLRLVQSLAKHVAPALHNLFLVHRLRSRIGEHERARLARELHDGLIQSLIGIELHLDAAKRTVAGASPATAGRLADIQRLLKEQICSVRHLMEQLRPHEVRGAQLFARLAESTERFRLETGINAQFLPGIARQQLPPRACRELSRVLDEALMNVRKHSGARNVVVRFGPVNGNWLLSVEDDGRGFCFAGRLAHHELDARNLGPVVIKERLRSIGATLAIDSRPGCGARLEVTIPRHRYS